jgi:Ala-tRNA(Pro) deacylase
VLFIVCWKKRIASNFWISLSANSAISSIQHPASDNQQLTTCNIQSALYGKSYLTEQRIMSDFYKFLENNRIEYERHDHSPVYTVEEARRLVPPLPAAKTKNLFLRDKKGQRHFLLVVPADKKVDIKALPQVVGSTRLSFGSSQRLKKYLGVEPGAVKLFAIFNDPRQAVELIVDENLWEAEAFQFHPLVNTSTLVISREQLRRFIAKTGHEVSVLKVPEIE